MFFLSRGFVPIALFYMYKKGIFGESFHMREVKSIIKIGVMMHLIDLTGFFMLRFGTHNILEKHIGLNEGQFALTKKK